MSPDKIKHLRKCLGMDAERFADLFHLEGKGRARSVSNWERGKTKPAKRITEFMERLAKQFH